MHMHTHTYTHTYSHTHLLAHTYTHTHTHTQAGVHIRDDLVSTIIAIISENTEVHVYIVQRLIVALRDDISQQPLTQVATWTLGEYGDLLITGQAGEEETVDVSIVLYLETTPNDD